VTATPHEANGHQRSDSAGSLTACPQPSAYEARQIEQIARWKSTEPSLLTQAVETVAQPISWGVKRVVPASVVRQAIQLLNRLADTRLRTGSGAAPFTQEDILDQRAIPLDACDQLAAQVIRQAERIGASRGLLIRQLGSAVIGRLPLQLVTAMATITKVGHCYGYPLDRPLDRAVLLDVLELALVETSTRRRDVLARLHAALDTPDASGLDVDEIAAAAGREVLADELADELVGRIPFIGGMIGYIGDRTFVRIAGEAAVRFFQERRLRDEGKVIDIPPARVHFRRSSVSEVGRAVGETVYAGGAILGFTVTLPVFAVGRLAGRWGGPLVAGAVAGGHQAVEDAEQLVATDADLKPAADVAAASV
jgi:hypothetical protein